MPPPSGVVLEGVSKRLGETRALRSVSLAVAESRGGLDAPGLSRRTLRS